MTHRMHHWLNPAAALAVAAVLAVAAAFGLILSKNQAPPQQDTILNVSYDPTRELYEHIDPAFAADYARRTGRHIRVIESHGGSSRQSRAIIAGEEPADAVTLAMFSDVDALRRHGLIPAGWEDRLPNHSQPYTSTIVFVVRRGNPKQIHDWPDLVRSGVEIVTPNPKTSGNGKLSALAAWGAIVTRGGQEVDAQRYLVEFYRHVRVLDAGARGAAATFALAEIGDVHLTWENEAIREAGNADGALQIVYPPVSILAEPVVAWVDANATRHGRLVETREYLEFLFSDAAQEIIANLGYRPYKPSTAQHWQPPPIVLFPVTAIAHDWADAEVKFFADDGIIDTVMKESHP